ncbi:[FeFe] hydrogenase H-cluster radical SAM maturase HydE [Anaerotruncus rubiinfantis]|uniref:[FeFe] hydrogenase H-cluster radical SAM maturase HydE n=1 Tax=Anaerotruncus rubiinfantis TaxID=1720200 RepID=UPI0034A49690
MRELIDRLEAERTLPPGDFVRLLTGFDRQLCDYLFEKSRRAARERFGNRVYIRGLIEFTNHCKCDCLYCGIRRSNQKARRYRLTLPEILSCCENGYALGFRTFVLQGGEDPYFTDERLCEIVRQMKRSWPDCAVTLSVGEKTERSYHLLREAGADRYLLRHETADPEHFARLHPPTQTLTSRMACLNTLKQLGFQTGAGFMVGSPWQTPETLVADLRFLHDFDPQMVGIGPFIPHADTPFKDFPTGGLELTLFLLGLVRLMLPDVLLPATTALATIALDGRERGILAGANVVMPNLSPTGVREKYTLYNGKLCIGDEAAESRARLQAKMESIGYTLTAERGDYRRLNSPKS